MGKVYFVSDLHLGIDGATDSRERELLFVRWLKTIEQDASALYLMGDLFDFYFEYKTVVPKGHVRMLGQLASMVDLGLPVYLFTGNHDMWIFRYFEQELGIPVYRSPIRKDIQGKKVYLGHGDGLGPGDAGYKFIKKVFANPVCQWLFEWIHPNIGIRIAQYWSRKSRYANPDLARFDKDDEWLVRYTLEILKEEYFDYFIFGHRHLPIDHRLNESKSRYINLGEWIYSRSYAVMENGNIQIKFFENESGKVFGD